MSETFRNEWVENVDVCVVGAGHAGCEAALACARLGLETVVFTVSIDSIALMPCNPNIGGSSKGHLVREVDALGGEMGKNIDKTFIQSKMLNVSKGPAVHSLRAQADKADYSRSMRKILENQEHLTVKQAEICDVIIEDKTVKGVVTYTGTTYMCKAVILCTGTYLKARCLCGEAITYTGPSGLQAANNLSTHLIENGVKLRRFKTGTPARMDKRSIDFTKMEEQFGDERIVPFSYSTDPESIQKEQISCWLTYTNEETHKIIRANLDRSPIYAGIIEGTGPRYCPSIEDKVVKFAEKERHQVFIEPEGLYTNEMYVGGMSSSLPEDVQLKMYRTVPGLENCKIVRNAYAIEYDCLEPNQLLPSLELKEISGMFCAGQFNGSSGYEEAAAQGIIAGINASMKLLGREPVILDRSQAYIGVLIDDLVTKDNREPYRMMTSRAEYRLLLRQDNADLRLRKIGHEVGLVSDEDYEKTLEKERLIEEEVLRLKSTTVGASKNIQEFLEKFGSSPLKTGTSIAELLCRPELSYEALAEIDPERPFLPEAVIEQVCIHIKYEGYIERQKHQVEQFKKTEKKLIPEDIDYDDVLSLRLEARQKLKQFKPLNIGQASRISGVTPADVSVLLVYLEQQRLRKQHE
ncbi:MAG: tRNA uridine-5-carboxymethylaminomethyl(34) synthesis enzyme MnmG [Lachnospiraceae bacterium]|nr:tRNA uridine-5-carboxymethylaminomethyl(34) synthesis enzyme MnmG [Lachnospiraceae bacterium]